MNAQVCLFLRLSLMLQTIHVHAFSLSLLLHPCLSLLLAAFVCSFTHDSQDQVAAEHANAQADHLSNSLPHGKQPGKRVQSVKCEYTISNYVSGCLCMQLRVQTRSLATAKCFCQEVQISAGSTSNTQPVATRHRDLF